MQTKKFFFILLLLFLSSFSSSSSSSSSSLDFMKPFGDVTQHKEDCKQGLGMENGLIKDSQLTASSSKQQAFFTATGARIRHEKKGGAWCPKDPINIQSEEFLQIDFNQSTKFTLIETQGRFDQGQGHEYTEWYKVRYWRDHRWVVYSNHKNQQIFRGNTNTYMVELNDLDPPIISSKIRIMPHNNQTKGKEVCLRLEVYGCVWGVGVASYEMRQGDKRGTDMRLVDKSYDGDVTIVDSSSYSSSFSPSLSYPPLAPSSSSSSSKMSWLRGGIGDLVDGKLGVFNFRRTYQMTGSCGWVGWKRKKKSRSEDDDDADDDDVWIVFNLEKVQKLHFIYFHILQSPSKDISVFKNAQFFFDFPKSSPSITFNNNQNNNMDGAKWLKVVLQGHMTRKLVMRLRHNSKWLLISEISFSFSDPTPEDTNSSKKANKDEELMKFYEKEAQKFQNGGQDGGKSDKDDFADDSDDYETYEDIEYLPSPHLPHHSYELLNYTVRDQMIRPGTTKMMVVGMSKTRMVLMVVSLVMGTVVCVVVVVVAVCWSRRRKEIYSQGLVTPYQSSPLSNKSDLPSSTAPSPPPSHPPVDSQQQPQQNCQQTQQNYSMLPQRLDQHTYYNTPLLKDKFKKQSYNNTISTNTKLLNNNNGNNYFATGNFFRKSPNNLKHNNTIDNTSNNFHNTNNNFHNSNNSNDTYEDINNFKTFIPINESFYSSSDDVYKTQNKVENNYNIVENNYPNNNIDHKPNKANDDYFINNTSNRFNTLFTQYQIKPQHKNNNNINNHTTTIQI